MLRTTEVPHASSAPPPRSAISHPRHGLGTALRAGAQPAGFSYPLDGLNSVDDLRARMLSGGCWLSGLPAILPTTAANVHAGIDLRATLGDTIYAIAPGTVDPTSDMIHSGYGPGWTPGRCLIERCVLPDGTAYLAVYGHTQNHRVKGGDRVEAGQALAEVGPGSPTRADPTCT